MQSKKTHILLWCCFFMEVGSLSFLRDLLGIYLSPMMFVASGCAMAFIITKLLLHPLHAIYITQNRSRNLLSLIPFILLAIGGAIWIQSLFPRFNIDPKNSDIIPHLQILVHRFYTGQVVYKEVTDFGYTIYPNYPTFTWFPFVLAEYWGIDYRLFSYVILCLSLSTFAVFIPRINRKKMWWAIVVPLLTLAIFIHAQPSAFGWTVEPLIVGYYVLLVISLYTRNVFFIAASMLLCLLSRYAVALWCPFFLILLCLYHSRKQAIQIVLFLVIGIVALYIVPFVLHDPGIVLKGFEYYTTCAIAEWKGQSWQQQGEVPHQLGQGYGFAIYFYKWINGDIARRLFILQIIHVGLCVLVLIIMALWYSRQSKKIPLHWFLIVSLKVYLVLFFAFIQVPYAYLYLTPLILSGVILSIFEMELRGIKK